MLYSSTTGGNASGDLDDSDSGHAKKKTKPTKSYLKEELVKCSKGQLFTEGGGQDKDGKKKRKDESNVLVVLDGFRGRLKDFQSTSSILEKDKDPDEMDVSKEVGGEATPAGKRCQGHSTLSSQHVLRAPS